MIYQLAKPYRLDERKIKLLQFDRGLSNSEIAKRLKTSVATITRHIKGQRRNLLIQRGIARCLRVKIDEITSDRREAA